MRWLFLALLLLAANPAHAVNAIGTETLMARYFGVNLHLSNCCGGHYEDIDRVIADLRFIGARRVRDFAITKPGMLERWKAVHRATGAPFNAAIPMASPAAQRRALAVMQDWLEQSPGLITHIEGSNEPDMPYATKLGATLEQSAALQEEVYRLGQKAGVKTVQLSVGAGWKPPFYEGHYKSFGKPPADYGNAHVYMNPGEAPTFALKRLGTLAAWSVDGKAVEVTEFGFYKTPLQDDAVTSAYMHMAPFASYLLGQAGLLIYALHDDVSNVVGFYDTKGEKRAFADYWHATTQLLADPNGKNLPPKEIDVRFTDQRTTAKTPLGIKNAVMYKSDGSIWIASFNETKPTAPDGGQTIGFDRPYPLLRVIDGRTGEQLQESRDANSISVSLPANHVMFVVASPQTNK